MITCPSKQCITCAESFFPCITFVLIHWYLLDSRCTYVFLPLFPLFPADCLFHGHVSLPHSGVSVLQSCHTGRSRRWYQVPLPPRQGFPGLYCRVLPFVNVQGSPLTPSIFICCCLLSPIVCKSPLVSTYGWYATNYNFICTVTFFPTPPVFDMLKEKRTNKHVDVAVAS